MKYSPHGRTNRRAVVKGLAAAAVGIAAARGAPARAAGADADVVVAGAGLSGLHAAMVLAERGFRVVVLEGSRRIGGRLLTLDDVPGRPEGGGAQVGQTYGRILWRASELGVPVAFTPSPRRTRVTMIANSPIMPEQWAASPLNPMPDGFRGLAPDAALFAAAARANPFGGLEAWRGASGAADVSARTFLEGFEFEDVAIAAIDKALNANDISAYSMANVWRTLRLYELDRDLGPSGEIEGGSQRLPEAMAAKLGDVVRMGETVRAVRNEGPGVVVATDAREWRAGFAILALPFPALSKILISPRPTGAQAAALAGLPYTQIIQVHFEAERRFWETDGLPAAMWTDGTFERIFTTHDPSSDEIVGFNAWINGEGAGALPGGDDAVAAMLSAELAALRPASEGRLRVNRIVRWTRGHSYAGGAYMHWAPGQIASWAGAMGAPIGRIHFAGEHLSNQHTGMEGAMESGEAAADAVTDAAG